VYLPRVDRAETTAATEREPAKAVAGSESVLVVEDDPQLRAVILRRLRSLGYRTLDACDASTAIDTLAADPRPVDLLLTDLVMPGIDGRALASRLLADRPELKVLFMSGYSEHVAVKTSALGPADHFIAKPFSSQDLSAAVRRALTPVAELA
jgi:CheY-like chemotaxis protein